METRFDVGLLPTPDEGLDVFYSVPKGCYFAQPRLKGEKMETRFDIGLLPMPDEGLDVFCCVLNGCYFAQPRLKGEKFGSQSLSTESVEFVTL
jgi:hypothetical protein